MNSSRSTETLDRIERIGMKIVSFVNARLTTSEPKDQLGSDLSRRSAIAEIGLLLLITLIFCGGLLDFSPESRLPGPEADVFQFLDWTLVQSIRQNHAFPLWNPYLDTGHPYVADPMLHAYNPLVTLPVLLFGVTAGFRIGLVLSFCLAALGMWFLGLTLGLRRVTRIWLALMYIFAGQPVARFFQGQYLFILGFAWIPWSLAFYLRALETGKRGACALTALSLALLFFSGNVYYSFFTLLALLVLSLVQIVRVSNDVPRIQVDRRKFRAALWIALLALGLIAIQLLPLIGYRPYINKARDIAGSHTLGQIFLDMTSKDSYRPDAFELLPAREEFYAYIGYTPFIALLYLPLAIRRIKKWLVPFGLILGFSLLWIGVDYLPWQDAFYRMELLAQFRHLLRILILTTTSLLVISALIYDHLLERIAELAGGSKSSWLQALQYRGVHLAQALLIFIMGIGLLDLYVTHRPIVNLDRKRDGVYQAAAWLRNQDHGVYYVRHNPNNYGHEALIANNLRFIEPWYHFTEIRSIPVDPWTYNRIVEPSPHYIIQSPQSPALQVEAVEQLASIRERDIFKLPMSLPYAFSLPTEVLNAPFEHGAIRLDEIKEALTPYASTNSVEVLHNGNAGETLVVLSSYFPDWKVFVDGEESTVNNASGLLATPVIPGATKYEFVYRPTMFYLGLAISTMTLFVMTVWVWQERLLPYLPFYATAKQFQDPAARQEAQRRMRAYLQGRVEMIRTASPLTAILSRRQKTPAQRDPRITSEQDQEPGDFKSAYAQWVRSTRLLLRMAFRIGSLPSLLFGLALIIYLAVRLIGLTEFPIYFFTDEAVQTVLAADLVRDGFHGYDGVFLPTYFENAWLFNLSLSVYAQVIPYMLFGKSVFVTRATSVLLGMTGAVAIALILRDCFRLKHWWAGVLVFSAVPAWFLHSRTAFETVIFVALMAWMLYFYLRYRQGQPNFLYAAVAFGGLAFYSYRGGQLVLIGFAGALFLLDLRYHYRHRRTVLGGLLLALIFTLPYMRFQLDHREETYFHLRMLDTYWLYDLPLRAKISRFIEIYLSALDPRFWLAPEGRELNRHVMKGYGHISPLMAPLLLTGFVLSLFNLDKPHYRATLTLALFSPLGAALVGVGITRVLIFVLPATMFTTVGISALLARITKARLEPSAAWLTFAVLVFFNSYMLWDALKNGPTWFQDYGLGGMQYGARQVFHTAEELIQEDPERTVYVSSTWANGTDILLRFFIPDGSPAYIGNADGFLDQLMELNDFMFFILTAEEFQELVESPKVSDVEIHDSIGLPNGRTGFYVVTFGYSDRARSIFAEEQQEREIPREGTTTWEGQTVNVSYPYLDMGGLHHIFDDDPFTLARVHSANPAIFTITFEEPTALAGIRLTTGSMDMQLSVEIQSEHDPDPLRFEETYMDLPDDPTVSLSFGETIDEILEMRIEILSLIPGDPFKIHLRELSWYRSEPVEP